jgi:hypothetical protein
MHQNHDIEETAIRMGPGGLYFGFGVNGCRLARVWNRRKKEKEGSLSLDPWSASVN